MLLFACSGVSSDLLDAQPSGSNGTSSDSGSGGDGRTTKSDAGKVTANDSGTGKVDSGGPKTGVVPAICGDSLTCNTTDPKCCGLQGDGISSTSYTCTADDSECTNMSLGVAVECRDNSDCGGSAPICCGVLKDPATTTGGYATVKCQSSCEEVSGGVLTANIIFCGSNDVCTADGFTCMASTILPGFNVCNGD